MTELADVLRDAGPAYLYRHGDRLLPSHRRVLRDLVLCRTPALGGQLSLCQKCGYEHLVYHSCRNRHCPKCQKNQAELWLEHQRGLLLPVNYGLATCTLPDALRSVARANQNVVYSIVMREAAHALLEMACDPRFIGGTTAIMAVLHTWTRALIYHLHVHMLFPIGGLSGTSWVKPRKARYILPGYGLAKKFRERVGIAFRRAGLADLVPASVWRKRWVAHVEPVGSGENALLYLSRYVFRVAISNDRILAFDGNRVTFSVSAHDGSTSRVNLDAQEFIRRFLQHVLPRHFVKVRYYGLWAPPCRDKLDLARSILERHLADVGRAVPRRAPKNLAIPGPQARCPKCGCPYASPPREIPRARAPP